MTGGSLRGRALRHAASTGLLAALVAFVACYSTGDGTSPPPKSIYFPVGLAVSPQGKALYVANSDFDLQYNGGTVQAYDLHAIRDDAYTNATTLLPGCPNAPQNPPTGNGQGGRTPLGATCAPPTDSSRYWRSSVTIGAFATDLQLAHIPNSTSDRLFIPVRGNASLTYVNVASDSFDFDCRVGGDGRCDDAFSVGNHPDREPLNTRGVSMPGEPFGMAMDDTKQVIAITHQTDTKTSLFLTGMGTKPDGSNDVPSLQFVLDGLPYGGVGITSVPHDPDALAPLVQRPAFLQTSRSAAEIDLLRYYSDEGYPYVVDAGPDSGPVTAFGSSNLRPYLIKEQTFAVTANASGNDSRGIAIDDTQRRACKLTAGNDPAKRAACARLPARVFIANRAPASLLLGEIGEASADGTYNPDQLAIYGNVPLTNGPSNVYLAPIVDANGNYALRVFIVCFDSQIIYIYDPDAQRIENLVKVGPGPFAMAFDTFTMDDVAARKPVPADPQAPPGSNLKNYRFAYIASFTDSYIQVLDLDASSHPPALGNGSTFETIVFTLGAPTQPKGAQ